MTEQEELYKEWKEVGQGRNLEVHHKKDLRKMKWNFGWRLLENVRWDKMRTSQEKYHEDQTNVEDDGMIDSIEGSRLNQEE